MIHAHIDWLPLPLLSRLGVPFVTTMHGRLDLPGLSELLRQFPRRGLRVDTRPSASAAAGGELDRHDPARTAIEQLSPCPSIKDPIWRVPRPSDRGKGPQDAIRIARAAGTPLRIAAKIPRGETVFFKKHLEPHVDGLAVQLVGEVDEAKKQPCPRRCAAAPLFPIDWPGAFRPPS